jgi:hypothetical protein
MLIGFGQPCGYGAQRPSIFDLRTQVFGIILKYSRKFV